MSNRIPFLNQYINTSNNTNFYNTYTSGSGVGAKSISNRRALIRRSSLNAGTLKDPKKGKCSGFCTAWGLQPMPGFNFLPIPPLYRPLAYNPPAYNFKLYYVYIINIPFSTPLSVIDILAKGTPPLIPLPRVTFEQAMKLEAVGIAQTTSRVPETAEKAHQIVPQKSLHYWNIVYDKAFSYSADFNQKLGQLYGNSGYSRASQFDVGFAPIGSVITNNLYGGSQIPFNSQLFNEMVYPGPARDGAVQTAKTGGGGGPPNQKLLVAIYDPDQKNLITSTFDPPHP
jgi:hypothetical protein